MFPRLKAHHQRYFSLLRWPYTFTAFVVVCVLLAHGIDTCTAHLGGFSNIVVSAEAVTELCPNEAFDNCSICLSHPDRQLDCCNQFTEIAVLNSLQHSPNPQPDLINVAYFIIPAKPQLVILSGVVDSRAGPSFATPLPLYLRSSLPVRAPPFTI